MALIKKLKRIQYIDYLIQSKIACTSKTISEKLGVSERQLINIIKVMKELGAPIKYCKKRKIYFYDEFKIFTFEYKKNLD